MFRRLSITLLLALMASAALAQPDDCPGFRNPVMFETWDPNYFWTGRVGLRIYPAHSDDTTTGYHIMSTCVTAPDIPAENILDDQYKSPATCANMYEYADTEVEGGFDFSHDRFLIITQENAGIDTLTYYNGTGMQRIPADYNTAIRLGDMYTCGKNNNSIDTTYGAEALFYTMKVTASNALLIINYAIVARKYDHSAYDAGEFIIRVVKQNDDGTWPNEPINDNLWYKVCAPTFEGDLPAPWLQGFDNGASASFCYKPWSSVAINLMDYYLDNVRIEMYTSDCIYNFDAIYAYICGDYRPMVLSSSGCPAINSNVIDTLTAPADMLEYKWHVSIDTAVDDLYDTILNDIPWRLVSTSTTSNIYTPVLDDFTNSVGDTVAKKTFRCVMTSALDPNKPFDSKIYANVTNRRPYIKYEYTRHCDRKYDFKDLSVSLNNEALADDSTSWIIYSDTLCTRPIDTIYGRETSYQFPQGGHYGIRLTAYTYDMQCGASTTFKLDVADNPEANIIIEEKYLCQGEEAFVRFKMDNADTMQIYIDGTLVAESYDSVFIHTFTTSLGPTPMMLTVANDFGCRDTVVDTIYTYGIPKLVVEPEDATICPREEVHITALGVPTYSWFSTPVDTSLERQQNQQTIIVYPDTTTLYGIHAVTISRCKVSNQTVIVEVVPEPIPTIKLENDYINFDFPAVSAEDASPYRYTTYWEFSDGYTYEGAKVNRQLDGMQKGDILGIYMKTCNKADCCRDTTDTVEVKLFMHWFPNVFTPAADANNRFGVITSLPLIEYELYVYNRQGMLMFHTDDPAETWDGTYNGKPCPTGAYAYAYRVAFDNNDKTIFTGRGTVTLLR